MQTWRISRPPIGDRFPLGSHEDIVRIGQVLIADRTQQILVAGCATHATVATGVSSEGSIAVSGDGSLFALENAGSIYVCSTATGCGASPQSVPLMSAVQAAVSNQGKVGAASGASGLVFDGSSPPNLYWIGTGGLVRCGVSASGNTRSCASLTTLVAGAKPTSGIALDGTSVYYAQQGSILQVAK